MKLIAQIEQLFPDVEQVVAGSDFGRDAIEKARSVVDKARMLIKAGRLEELSEQIDAALYLNHPYGRPIIGWRHEIEALTRDDAIAFYKRFYTPNNAVLVIAGDVSPEEVRPMIEETYGKVP